MFDCTQFLSLAQNMSGSNNSEAEHRSAISRAYYAAFHWAKIAATKDGLRLSKTGDDHEKVRTWIDKNFDYIGNDFSDLKRMRRRADYDLDASSIRIFDDAASAIDLAQGILDQIRHYE